MRAKWLVMFALFGLAAYAAGCGSDRNDGTYVDPYADEVGGTGSGGAAPPPSVGDVGVSSQPTGDATGGGMYGERVYAGDGRPGDDLSRSDFEVMKKIGKEYGEARKLYQDYFSQKEKGQEDKSSLQRAISMYEQLLTQLESMQKSHPDNHAVEELFSNVSQERRNLLLEQ